MNFTNLIRFLFEVLSYPMHPATTMRSRWPAMVALGAAVLMTTTACSDDPFAFDWSDAPDTVLLYSLARPEINLVSAFDFFQRNAVRVEGAQSTGSWDAAVDTEGGEIVLVPPGAFGVVGSARITTLEGMSLADVTEAPSDTLVYVADEVVPVRMGTVYIIKTNRTPGSFGRNCVYYAKMQAIDIDPVGGTLRFEFVTNPVCNSLDLVPPN